MSASGPVPQGVPRARSTLLLSSVLLLSTLLTVSQAQITMDGSLGPARPLTGPHYRIGVELGQIRGSNLFQSFGQFNVGTGESASFTGPPAIANILSRVTGGQPSSINGLLRSEIVGANLYLLNPSGVLFGANAALEVSGSFHVSTADFLRFADGAKFQASLAQESVLTVASPAAFGFLGPAPAPITIRGSSLRVPEGKALSVVGGDIEFVGNGLLTANSAPTLRAPRGRIQLASVASPGEVRFSPLELAPDLQLDSFTRLGRLALSQGAFLNASGNGGGTVLIRGDRLRLDGSQIFANNLGPVDGTGLGVDLRVAADVVMANEALVTSDTLGAGRARDLRLTAGSVHLDDSVIGSRVFSRGNAGNIEVQVGRLTLTGGAQISNSTRSSGRGGELSVVATDAIAIAGVNSEGNSSGLFSVTFDQGDAGRLFVSAPLLTMDDSARLNTVARLGSRGNAGSVEVRVGRLTLTGGAQINSSTFGPGRGGEVTVVATDAIDIAGRSPFGSSGLFSSTSGQGDAGRLFVSAPLLTMDEGLIATNALTGSRGNAGSVEVRVGRLTLTRVAQIASGTFGPGRGGEVTVVATDRIDIAGRNPDFSSAIVSSTFGQGDAGRLFVSAPLLTIDDGAGIISRARLGSQGNAGSIEVRAGRLTLTGGGRINSSTDGPGRGGEMTVVATDQIDISGRGPEGFSSGLFSSTSGRGPGGNLRLAASHIQLSDVGTISASSTGDGAAGTLRIQAGETFRSQGGLMTTAAARAGGGRIELHAGSLIQLIDSELTTAVAGGGSDAGNIFMDSPFVILDQSLISANAFAGRGGNIGIEAGVFLADPDSRVSASSTLGISGLVNIRAPVTNLVGTLAPLPQTVVSAAALLPARCAVRLSGDRASSLVVGGRDGLASEPGDLLSGPLLLDTQLAMEPAEWGEARGYSPASRFALLGRAAERLPRLQGGQSAGFSPVTLEWRCGE